MRQGPPQEETALVLLVNGKCTQKVLLKPVVWAMNWGPLDSPRATIQSE